MNGLMVGERPARIVAVSRACLAALLLIAVTVDPSRVQSNAIYAILGVMISYLLVSLLLLALTWDSWRRDWQLAPLAHGIDITLFAAMVFLNEGYTSPFFTFFVFLILSAAVRWGRGITILTALLVVMIFFLAGFLSLAVGLGEFDLQRFIIRGAYVGVFSTLLIAFNLHERRERAALRLAGRLTDNRQARVDLAEASRDIAHALGSSRLQILYWETDEPRIWSVSFDRGGVETRQLTLEGVDSDGNCRLPRAALLFDRASGAMLQSSSRRRRVDRIPAGMGGLFALTPFASGIAAPLPGSHEQGLIVAEVEGLSYAHLPRAEAAAAALTRALDRAAALREEARAREFEARQVLARDLHDGVAQLLAGIALRLEAVPRKHRMSRAAIDELRNAQALIADSQRHIRQYMMNLRHPQRWDRPHDLAPALRQVTEEMCRQWPIECRFVATGDAVMLSLAVIHEISQLVREAIANAVRHGGAKTIDVQVQGDLRGVLSLKIVDDGAGFDGDGSEASVSVELLPRSLQDRADSLGGRLTATTGPTGTAVSVEFPVAAA